VADARPMAGRRTIAGPAPRRGALGAAAGGGAAGGAGCPWVPHSHARRLRPPPRACVRCPGVTVPVAGQRQSARSFTTGGSTGLALSRGSNAGRGQTRFKNWGAPRALRARPATSWGVFFGGRKSRSGARPRLGQPRCDGELGCSAVGRGVVKGEGGRRRRSSRQRRAGAPAHPTAATGPRRGGAARRQRAGDGDWGKCWCGQAPAPGCGPGRGGNVARRRPPSWAAAPRGQGG
jgi:hypothetical protein